MVKTERCQRRGISSSGDVQYLLAIHYQVSTATGLYHFSASSSVLHFTVIEAAVTMIATIILACVGVSVSSFVIGVMRSMLTVVMDVGSVQGVLLVLNIAVLSFDFLLVSILVSFDNVLVESFVGWILID